MYESVRLTWWGGDEGVGGSDGVLDNVPHLECAVHVPGHQVVVVLVRAHYDAPSCQHIHNQFRFYIVIQ